MVAELHQVEAQRSCCCEGVLAERGAREDLAVEDAVGEALVQRGARWWLFVRTCAKGQADFAVMGGDEVGAEVVAALLKE